MKAPTSVNHYMGHQTLGNSRFAYGIRRGNIAYPLILILKLLLFAIGVMDNPGGTFCKVLLRYLRMRRFSLLFTTDFSYPVALSCRR